MKIKDIQKKYGFNFKSCLGQNFFNNDTLLEEILDKLNLTKDCTVLEIGPGFGVLTEKLLRRVKKVVCIEIDKNAVVVLNQEFKEYNNLEIINEDFLKVNLKDIDNLKGKISVIANIPYYITTPILEKLFKSELNIDFLAVMVQKEVGDRILASPSTKEYGSLTLFVNYYSKVSIIKKISSSNFIPRPKVDSVFLRCDILNNRFFKDINVENEFLKFVKRCFSMRRKNLLNVFGQFNIGKDHTRKVLLDLKIDHNKRIEDLDLNDIQNIFIELNKLNQF